MSKKYDIEVRKWPGRPQPKIIRRTVRSEPFGNFCPVFCTFQGKKCLVESEAPHLDDPFRCNEKDHVGKLFIQPRGKDGKVTGSWGWEK